MKRNNKGFTLAELLIVIAIIAILIAIAIPAFGSSLDNARLQTDHANMRNAYAIAQVANLQGVIEVDGIETKLDTFTGAYFGADGAVTSNDADAFVTLIKPKNTDQCKSSAFCTSGGKDGNPIAHDKGQIIKIEKDTTSGDLYFLLEAAPTGTPGP